MVPTKKSELNVQTFLTSKYKIYLSDRENAIYREFGKI